MAKGGVPVVSFPDRFFRFYFSVVIEKSGLGTRLVYRLLRIGLEVERFEFGILSIPTTEQFLN